ncbi:uncharacterized protein K02A2.6-like [Papilio machaon]|uniref:uncharacterized protein K02A2.6-like n=1 Tax=Papilio machaon TaxID=76193 RepID=UPI001E665678|nr:uncharacterized protein K02A2.6-like [Papilio machaon]
MLLTHFGVLSCFDHSEQMWKTYKNRITQWFIANDVNHLTDATGVKRRAILLSALSEGTYKLAADLALPKELNEVPYEDILGILDAYFTPKRVGFGERYKFYAAVQQPAESFMQWAARLRGLTAHCGFSNLEEVLRDRFIMGMLPGFEKEEIFGKDLSGLTLASVVELAENVRCARAGAACAAAATSVVVAAPTEVSCKTGQPNKSELRVSESRSEKVQCSVCGYFNHRTPECRFINYTCKKCKQTGHLRRMCKKVNLVTSAVTRGSDENDDDGELYHIRSFRGEPMVECVRLNGVTLKFEIDSGSAVTVISDITWRRNFHKLSLSRSDKKLMGYTGERINCLGVMRDSKMLFGGVNRAIDVYVVRGGGPTLLGRDFISKFNLELAPVKYCESSLSIEQLQARFSKTFADTLGSFKKYKIKLFLKENSKPIFFKARPIAFALREKVTEELNRLVDLGVLKPVDYSEYASPIVPVLKRNGSVRICADYSVSINKQLVVEQFPLPTVHELFSKLHGGEQFTKLDLSSAYNQLCLDDESQKLTCINTHRGLYQYTRLVFGLSSAPAIFQRAMETVLAGLDGVLCLLDDILITGCNREEHLTRLNSVLQRLEEAGLTLQKEKCEFFKDEINYLGYVINKNGLKKSPDKIKAIIDAPRPRNVSQLQSFLGLANYYRNFVPGASMMLSPLYELLKKNTKWKWTKIHSDAFLAIKKCLASDSVLAHFNQKAKLILTVDASPTGLGAILSQVGEDGVEKPVSFASRTLTPAEHRYSQIQKEATAIIFGVRRFHQYLYGRADPFVLRTDHKPLITIFGPHKGIPEVSANRLQRYAMFLSAYNYVIEYVRSADNTADYLSRASLPGAGERGARTTEAGRASCADAAAALCDRAAYVCFVVDGTLPMTVSELRNETAKDIIMSRVMNHVLNGWPNKVTDLKLKPYFLCRYQLSVENGCLMRGHKVIIPSSLRKKVMDELHTSHLGIVKTKAEARSRFWFPGVDEAIENLIGSCEVCTRLRPSPPRTKLVPWRFPPQPFYRVHIDFLGPLNGRTYLVVVDSYTKWVEVYDMNANTTSYAVVERLYEYIARYGLPKTIVSDNGPSFASQEFSKFCAGNGISHLTTPAYHPASNGQAESLVKIVKKGIRSSVMSSRTAKECKLRLFRFLFDYRNSIHSTTGFSPAELVYGRKLRARLDLINPREPSSSFGTLADVVHDMQQAQIVAHGGKNKIFFSPGEQVFYKKFSGNNKFTWHKGTVLRRLGKVLYVIQDNDTLVTTKKHKNQLWLCKADVTATNVNSRDVDDDDDEIVVSIPTSPTSSGQPGVTQGISDGEQPEGEGEEACSPPHTPLVNHPNVTVARGVRRPAQSEEDDCVG